MKLINRIYPFSLVQTQLLVLYLFLMFLDYGSYGYYVFYFSLAYLWYHKAFKLVDNYFLLLLFWGGSYGITLWYNTGLLNYGAVLMPIINCPVLYLAGKYLVKQNSIKSLPYIIFIFVLALAFISMLSIILDMQENGFLTTAVGRNVPLIGLSSLSYVAATGLSSRLMPLVLYFVCIFLPIDKKTKLVFVISSLIAIICGVRIQSRTLVLCLVVGVFITTILNWSKFLFKQKLYFVLISILLAISIVYLVNNYSAELGVIERFQSDELETGGGRTYRLIAVAENMFNYPLGDMPSNITYAHNMWFDCARIVGILPFIILVILSITYARIFFFVIRKIRRNLLLKNMLLMQSFLLLVVFFCEPILEGIPMLFQYFCLLYGMVVALMKSKYVYYDC